MKTVVIVSPGLSGAGAVSDYLLSRADFVSPFKKSVDYKQDYEFRVVSDPFGIDHLYKSFYQNFSINNAAYAHSQFKKYIQNLKKLKDIKSGEKIYNDDFFYNVEKYLKKIIKISYYGLPQHYRISMSNYQKIIWKLKNANKKNFAQNTKFYEMIIPVEEKIFIKESKKLLLKILITHNRKQKKNVVVDQGGNFWRPISSTKYYPDCKVIQVTRDPKGVFSSMKTRKSLSYPGNDIRTFVNWYKEMNKKRSFIEEKNTLKIKFEDFILNHEYSTKRINKFLNLKNYKAIFDLENSKKNLFKYKKNLNQKEIRFINSNLKQFINLND